MTILDYLRPVWTIRATYSGMDGSLSELEQWLEPGYYWQARKSANHLNAFYGSRDYWTRVAYDVVKSSYFAEDQSS